MPAESKPPKGVSGRVRQIIRPPHRAIGEYAASLGYKDLIYLNMGEPDFPSPPHVIEAARRAMEEGFTHYTSERGLPELREAIANKLRERGVEASADGVIITCGAAEALFATILCLVDPGDEVVLPDPYYPPYMSATLLASGKPTLIPLNEQLEWSHEAIKERVTDRAKLIIVNSPNNPTGGVFGDGTLKAILDAAEEAGAYILSDEVYEFFTYDGADAPSIAKYCLLYTSPSPRDRG